MMREMGSPTGRCVRGALAVTVALALSGCAFGQPTNPRGGLDASAPRDAGGPRPDTGGPVDAGSPSGIDAGRDAGSPVDAGAPVDAGPPDAGCFAETCDGTDEDCDGTVDEAAGCPCDVVSRDGHGYMLCPGPRTWLAARMHCELFGYSLAVVEDAAEDAFVFGEVDGRSFDDTWLGHNDVLTEGTWVWLDGVPLAYTHWDAGEPNDSGGEDCGVVMTAAGRESEWDDRSCGDERPYVCESPPP